MLIYYTGDLITPDGSDTGIYGDPCEPGEGETLTQGWVSPDWSRFTVYDERESVRPDTWTPDDGPMIDWAIERILKRLHYVEDSNGWETFYAADGDDDWRTGAHMRLAAHLHDAPDSIVAAVTYGIAFMCSLR